MIIEKGKLDGSIRLFLASGGTGVTGLTSGDVEIRFFTADGEEGEAAGFDLTEVGAANWPGHYLLTSYPDELVAVAGPACLKATGEDFDDVQVDLDISEDAERVHKLYRLAYSRLSWNVDESRWDLYDESDELLGWFPAEDANGNPAIVDSTHPITRLEFVQAT